MPNIARNMTDLIGNTPLIEPEGKSFDSLNSRLLFKLEMFNPCSSVKDRIGWNMLKVAEEEGEINKDTTIIEATSGNTGIGLAFVCAARGYKLVICMPDTMSIERRNMLKAFGAELVLTSGAKGMKGAIAKAEELHKEIPRSWIPRQFENCYNPDVHFKTTGPEIWRDTDGKVDILVTGVGTGGTLTGAGGFLKQQNKNLKIIAVEPKDSPVLSGGDPGPHKIQGIGAGFVPTVLAKQLIDEVITVSNEEAMEMGRKLTREHGIMVGISSGAAAHAGFVVAKRESDKTIVAVLPDFGERYLSTPMFTELDQ